MKIVNEIELHQKSVEYMNHVFSMYKEVDKLNEFVKNPIIHIYPKRDTYDENGELFGFIDALLFEIHVYDLKERVIWKSKNMLYDEINSFDDLKINRIRVFKDMSTMIVLEGNYRLYGTARVFYIERCCE